MKQVPTLLIGSISVVLTLLPGISNAAELHELIFDTNTLETDSGYYQPILSNPLFEELQIDSNFLFAYNSSDNYTVGLNYTDVIIGNDDQNNRSNSNFLVMLQFKF